MKKFSEKIQKLSEFFLKEVGHIRKEPLRFRFSACLRANQPWLLLQQKQRD
ncbi:hypothetical protein HMPREF9999_01427 [Alloprevotella sp. oral taxon 473 str. F0040]|nr:hypothetical protein HMPREF9999_01427 [Alloprevotella sp. oral taxon 473 str. F0040]